MKKSLFIFAGLSFLAALTAADADPVKTAEVQKGIRTEADASWWGFNESDATECLQKAISSGAKKLIVPNMGKPWILSKTVNLASNQEIVLAKGTVIEAKKGAFKSVWLGLFLGLGVKNSVFRGEGDNILRMQINDYNNRKLYKVSEWRHGFFISGCQDIKISNITVKDTGGDGIAIGSHRSPSRNVLIENVTLDNNMRLGIGVVSAENLTIRKCRFLNARHMPPCGGIDMEPNYPYESMSNILIEDCEFQNNKFNAVTLAVNQLNKTSKPVSLTVRNCRKVDGTGSAVWIMGMKPNGDGVKGKVIIENCRLSRPIMFTNVAKEHFSVLIKNTEIVIPAAVKPTDKFAAVKVENKGNHDKTIGGIVFDNVKITSKNPACEAVSLTFFGVAKCVEPFSGTLSFNGKKVDFKPIVAESQKRLAELVSLKKPVEPDLTKLQPAKVSAPYTAAYRMPLRGVGIFLVAGTKGKKVSFSTKMWNFYKSNAFIYSVKSPSGREVMKKTTLSHEVTNWLEHSFTAEETGIYQVSFTPGINALEIRSDAPSGYLLKNGQIIFLKPAGRMYFTVPAGTDKFAFTISADPNVNVKIVDPAGKVRFEKKNIKAAELVSVKCEKAPQDQVWSLMLTHAVWLTTVNMHAPLVPIFSENAELLLKPVK